MKTYKAHLNQGAGCDYTIACGEKLINISAESMDEAWKKLLEIIKKIILMTIQDWKKQKFLK